MDRRKDSQTKRVKLPEEYTKMIAEIFYKNFKKNLEKNEVFIVCGDLYTDEIVISVSLTTRSNPLRLLTCYVSADFNNQKDTSQEAVQISIGQCVDGIAGFYATFFEEGRPMDYEVEYRQDWIAIHLDAKIAASEQNKIHMKINRDNPTLETQADAILEADTIAQSKKPVKKKKTLH